MADVDRQPRKASRPRRRKPPAAAAAPEPAAPPPRPEASPARDDFRLDRPTLKRALFEVAIVAIGVLLALAADEARQMLGRQEAAREARSAVRSEMLENRGRLFNKLRLVGEAYRMLEADPEQAALLVRETRNRQVPLFDSAWTMAVETGALRWLPREERALLAEAYTSQRINHEVITQEMARWTELAAFPAGPLPAADDEARLRAVRVWQGYAVRVGVANCLHAARLERALDPRLPRESMFGLCDSYRPEHGPARLYRAWGVAAPARR
jgi:hypothetical protein